MLPTAHRTGLISCFRCLLIGDGAAWRWRDGTAEPRVAAVDARALTMRRRTAAWDEATLVEVPFALAQAYDPLAWVMLGLRRGDYDGEIASGGFSALDAQGRPRVAAGTMAVGLMVVLVPERHWTAWQRACAVAPSWSADDEAELFARARALGWRD